MLFESFTDNNSCDDYNSDKDTAKFTFDTVVAG